MDLNISGLNQPGVNLGGLLSMGGLSGNPTAMSGGTQAGQGGAGMSPGLGLQDLLQMLQGQQGEAPGVGMGQALGTLPTSVAQQQQSGFGMLPDLGQSYLTAGATGGGTIAQGPSQSVDPLAVIQKSLGLAQKGASATGTSDTSLLASPTADTSQFDPTGQTQTPAFQSYRAGEMQDFSGLADMLKTFGSVPPGSSAFSLGPGATPNTPYFMMEGVGTPDESFQMLMNLDQEGATPLPSPTTPGVEGSLGGFNPTLGNALGVAGGLAGLAGGIQSGNPYGITGGALGTAGNVANMLGYTGAGTLIGGLGGPLALASGIETGNPMSLASGTLQTYQTLAALSQMFPELGIQLPSLGTLGSQAFSAIAPELAQSLGLGAEAGVGAGAGAAAGAGAGAEGTAAGTGAALGGGALALPVALAAIGYGIWSANEAHQMESLLSKSKEAINLRQALPGAAQDIQRLGALPPDLIPYFGTEQLQALMPQIEQGLVERRGLLSKIEQSKGSEAPSRVPRMDVGGVQNLMQYADQTLPYLSAAVQDELARRQAPLTSYFHPLGQQDILGLAGAGANLSPEQIAGIGPGNMLASLQALQAGRPLTGLPSPATGVGSSRLGAVNQLAQSGSGMEYAPYFFQGPQLQALQQAQQAYPGQQAAYEASLGSESAQPLAAPQTPLALWQQMLGTYALPQTPQGMVAQATAPSAPPVAPPPTVAQQPMTPQQQALRQMLLQSPTFAARGGEDPYLPLLFAQYGLA